MSSISLSSLSYRFTFRSFSMMASFVQAVCQGARVTRHNGVVQPDGYLLASIVVVQWPCGNTEKIKEDDFCDVEM